MEIEDIMDIRLIEEFWPGQREGIRTARIEVFTLNEHWPDEVGRITCSDPIFSWLYSELEGLKYEIA